MSSLLAALLCCAETILRMRVLRYKDFAHARFTAHKEFCACAFYGTQIILRMRI
jgi:hypothetical protein